MAMCVERLAPRVDSVLRRAALVYAAMAWSVVTNQLAAAGQGNNVPPTASYGAIPPRQLVTWLGVAGRVGSARRPSDTGRPPRDAKRQGDRRIDR